MSEEVGGFGVIGGGWVVRELPVVGGGTVSWWERVEASGVGIPEPVLAEQCKRELEVLIRHGLVKRERAADEAAGLVPLPARQRVPERGLAAFPAGALGAEWSVAALLPGG